MSYSALSPKGVASFNRLSESTESASAVDMAEYSHLNRESLERLDSLVSDYLLFRSYKQTQAQLFMDKRSPSKRSETDARNARNQIMRFLNALDGGDYTRYADPSHVLSRTDTRRTPRCHADAATSTR